MNSGAKDTQPRTQQCFEESLELRAEPTRSARGQGAADQISISGRQLQSAAACRAPVSWRPARRSSRAGRTSGRLLRDELIRRCLWHLGATLFSLPPPPPVAVDSVAAHSRDARPPRTAWRSDFRAGGLRASSSWPEREANHVIVTSSSPASRSSRTREPDSASERLSGEPRVACARALASEH